MDKLQKFPKNFFKQFKNSGELSDYLQSIFKEGTQQLLEAELDEHLGYEKYSPEGVHSGNSRNGTGNKRLKTKLGEVDINVPRDRNATFDPQVVPKRKRVVEDIEDIVISLYAKGMTVRDIEEQINDIYGVDMSDSTISNITDKIIVHIDQWQSRPLEQVYFVLWLDCIVFKIRHDGKVVNKAIYLAIGLNQHGKKEVLGMWINETESASFWMNVLTEIKARGVEDVLIASTDNLTGFTDAIQGVFPQAATQVCVVHQIRNTLRYVVWKDKKELSVDLRAIYGAPTRKAAEQALNRFAEKWNSKYPYIIKSWKANWEKLTTFYDYPVEIRKIIYTTNIIENLNRNIRKFNKNRTSFPDDKAVQKAVYLAIVQISKKWTMPVRNWPLIINQFITIFEKRCKINI